MAVGKIEGKDSKEETLKNISMKDILLIKKFLPNYTFVINGSKTEDTYNLTLSKKEIQ
ncbi:MAG TPA: hypothetical protein PK357_01835 [Candidatus Pacearchaeota archaeon]|nr:hypothetical protein [Candidatus Pacearchaeota archaeon]